MKAVFGDVHYALAATGLISTYLLVFLGSISPMHTRLSLALLGLLCVIIACMAGYGLSFDLGWGSTEMTAVLPVLMLGIGVDDMFVICNSVDQ